MWVKRLTKNEKEKWMAAPTVDIHNYWSELQSVEITKVDTILNQLIWNNRFITIQKTLFR